MTNEMQADRDALITLFGRHPSAHIYGLADLEDQYWSRSTWWLRADAAVGLIGIPGSDASVVYAVSAADAAGTKSLLSDLAAAGDLPDHFMITGPTGLRAVLLSSRQVGWYASHQKMLLAKPTHPYRSSGPTPRRLGLDHAASIEALRSTDPDSGGFFYPGLVEIGPYFGVFVSDELVAMAGVHVASRRFDVVAIGNVFTHPDHRGRGLANIVMVRLLEELAGEYRLIGLNVEKTNVGAIRLYERLGFEWVMDYDEAVVLGIHG